MNGKTLVIKNNKGGVGKSFLTVQLAHALAVLFDKRVLILTSDDQNNIFNYTIRPIPDFKEGLKAAVKNGESDFIKLKENVEFLPLEDSHLGNSFVNELPVFVKKMKEKYDFILIDSSPVLRLDQVFVDLADYFIIPTIADEVTTNSILKFMDSIDVQKIAAIVVNKFQLREVQINWETFLKDKLEDTNIFLTKIKNNSFIEKLLDKGKTIFETTAKEAEETQGELIELVGHILTLK